MEDNDDDDDDDNDDDDINMRFARFEALLDRRPILLSSVLLRQNPNNVAEWLKRGELFSSPVQIINTYTEAVKTVDPMKADGKVSDLWVNFAKYYETNNNFNNADMVFAKAVQAKYRYIYIYIYIYIHVYVHIYFIF